MVPSSLMRDSTDRVKTPVSSMGAVRANFRDWLASDRSKRAKIARELDCPAWRPSFGLRVFTRSASDEIANAALTRSGNAGARVAIMRAVADVTIR